MVEGISLVDGSFPRQCGVPNAMFGNLRLKKLFIGGFLDRQMFRLKSK